MTSSINPPVQHVFILGAKSIGQYGGYETFIDRLIEAHRNEPRIKYHIACKANGDGCMDESKLQAITVLKRGQDGGVAEFEYNNAHVFKLHCPNIGPGVAIYYDREAFKYAIRYCKAQGLEHPIFYILAYRIGPFIQSFAKQIHELGGTLYLNPDGHEWKRTVWPAPVRMYWKWSEKKMVRAADGLICDSREIERYHRQTHGVKNTFYISYGADIDEASPGGSEHGLTEWLRDHDLARGGYYLVVGRFVPENNFDVMIREFRRCGSQRKLVLITRENPKYQERLDRDYGWRSDPRIRFVGSVYDKALLKMIRKDAYGYIHGHEVGGTNPSLLEALGSTKLNLLLDVPFNREVGQDSALYWTKDEGSLGKLIDDAEGMESADIDALGRRAKDRILNAYTWKAVGEKYKELWLKKR